MIDITQFYKGFYLQKERANSQLANFSDKLRVAPIKFCPQIEFPKIDQKHFAFAENNINGDIEYHNGLEKFLQIKNDNYIIYIFDNHNHSLFFRYYELYYQNLLGKNIKLIHIDQHSDCRENKNILTLDFSKKEIEKVFQFTNEKCNVGNFIPPAIQSGLISSQQQIRSLTSLKGLKKEKDLNYILDIDLDFCLSGINKNKIDSELIQALNIKFKELSQYAICITISTSPYFLNQELAIKILETILKF